MNRRIIIHPKPEYDPYIKMFLSAAQGGCECKNCEYFRWKYNLSFADGMEMYRKYEATQQSERTPEAGNDGNE